MENTLTIDGKLRKEMIQAATDKLAAVLAQIEAKGLIKPVNGQTVIPIRLARGPVMEYLHEIYNKSVKPAQTPPLTNGLYDIVNEAAAGLGIERRFVRINSGFLEPLEGVVVGKVPSKGADQYWVRNSRLTL